jgi:hypothetical protein
MGTKFECEVDVEGEVDMMDHGEERDSWRWGGRYEGGIAKCRSLRVH